jgi:hypothetical protein
MSEYIEESALGNHMGIGCLVRTWKDGSKLEIEFTDASYDWLTDPRLGRENGEITPCGELNKQYLYKKLGEFIAMKLAGSQHQLEKDSYLDHEKHVNTWYNYRNKIRELTDVELSLLAEKYTGADGLDVVDYGRAIMRAYREKLND